MSVNMKFIFDKNNGQVMLLSVLILSSIIAVVTALASLLISFQLRQVTDARESAEAIFAADTGIECVLWKQFGSSNSVTCPSPNTDFVMPGGESFRIKQITNDPATGNQTWLSVGRSASGRTARALQISLVKR